MLGGIWFTYVTQGSEGWREYWSRVVDAERVPAKWFLVIFLFAPCLMAGAVLIDIALDSNSTLAQIGNRATPFFTTPLVVVLFLLRVFIYGPLPEELGWRGYVLDRLQARWHALGRVDSFDPEHC
jgi:membrane protease YdiL (CAAX protease family)